MSLKKTSSKKSNKSGSALRRKRTVEVSMLSDAQFVEGNGEGSRHKRNGSEESSEVSRANELTLRAWQHLYAKRARFGKVSQD